MSMRSPLRSRAGVRGAIATAGAALLALSLAACGGGAPAATEPVNLVDTGAELDEITVALPGSLANLYTGVEGGILNYYVASTVQEGLVGIDETGAVVPSLAESWETPDENTYVFQLRDDATFHDGAPVTPEDVVFSLQQAQDEVASPSLSWYLYNMSSVEVTGANEVTVTTAEPDQAFLKNLSTAGSAFITPQAHWEAVGGAVGTSESLLPGSGPYEVTEFQPDSHVTLVRNDNWWGGTPAVKQINIEFIPDENTRLLAAQKGDIDIAFNVPIGQADQWREIDGVRVENVNDLSYVGLLFDQNVAPFDDAKVREAIALAVDRQTIVDRLLRGNGEVATTIMTPESIESVVGADEARKMLAGVTQHEFNLDDARAALEESSVPEGFELELTFPNTGPQLGTAAQAIGESLGEIGIEVAVKEVPIETWLATIGDGEHGLSYMWYFSTTGDPAEVPAYLIGPDNPNGFVSDEAAALLSESNAAADPEERIDLILQLEELSATEVVNAPLWWGQALTSFTNRVGLADYSAYSFVGPWGAKLFAAEVAE